MANEKVLFQAGYYEFNNDAGLNFQLNRFYTYGVFSKDELMDIGGRIDSIEKWISLFMETGDWQNKRMNSSRQLHVIAQLSSIP